MVDPKYGGSDTGDDEPKPEPTTSGTEGLEPTVENPQAPELPSQEDAATSPATEPELDPPQ